MSTMFNQVVTASLLLCFLTVVASAQQQLKGRQLDSMAHVAAISMNPESKTSNSLASVEGSESVSSIALEGSLSGYLIEGTFTDTTCTTFVSGILQPLNTCFSMYEVLSNTRSYVRITATSTTWLKQYYRDEQCNVMGTTAKDSPYLSVCKESYFNTRDGYSFFIQPSKTVASSQSFVYVRWDVKHSQPFSLPSTILLTILPTFFNQLLYKKWHDLLSVWCRNGSSSSKCLSSHAVDIFCILQSLRFRWF